MPRDAEATRQRLLDAAIAEFAEFGIAGARVDRIALQAGSNKAQIYHYFGSKDQLFDAALESVLTGVICRTPVDVHDLPAYAARLTVLYEKHPYFMRLVTWQRLERSADVPVPFATDSAPSKVETITRAQADGILPGHFPPAVLLALLIQLSAAWCTLPLEFAMVVDLTQAERAGYVADAVRRLLADQDDPAPGVLP